MQRNLFAIKMKNFSYLLSFNAVLSYFLYAILNKLFIYDFSMITIHHKFLEA